MLARGPFGTKVDIWEKYTLSFLHEALSILQAANSGDWGGGGADWISGEGVQ